MARNTKKKDCTSYLGFLCEDTAPFVKTFNRAYEDKHGIKLNIPETVHEILKSLSKDGIDSIQPK